MNVYKFGGASIKDAAGVRNIQSVLELTKQKSLVIVVSAMGKTTNALEDVVAAYLDSSPELDARITSVYQNHWTIAQELFGQTSHPVFNEITLLFRQLRAFVDGNTSRQHAFVYDQIVSFGELLSTTIVVHYLQDQGTEAQWVDVRQYIKTDATFREAQVDWEATQAAISQQLPQSGFLVTQGFIGSEVGHNFTTTLGREGSDYTAAIFGFCLNAQEVTIWKDVPGVLNADPRHFKQTKLLNQISYREAIELAFYGASVIHPKTLQPLQRKEIPLFVKPFNNPLGEGTRVGKGPDLSPEIPCYILKDQLVLLELSALDFNFMMEDHIGEVFKTLHRSQMKVELIQNSAISFSVCVQDKYHRIDELLGQLRQHFRVEYHPKVTLYTLRYGTTQGALELTKGKTVLLRQESNQTLQLVLKAQK